MKKLLTCTIITLLMSSCYTSKVFHGNMTENTPQVEVASKGNSILLWGLVSLENSKQKASDVVGTKSNYTTVTKWTFVDGLLSCVTFGIYTPTTTKYYLPLEDK